MPKKKAVKPKGADEDRLFKVSLTSKDTDIKEFKASYQGNWSRFVRDALREKIQREQLMSRAHKRPAQKETLVSEAGAPTGSARAGLGKSIPLPSKTSLTEDEIRLGLLTQKEDT